MDNTTNVAAPANSYDIVVTLRDESKYIAYRNCHGEEVDHRFNSSRLQFIYQPISRLEREEQCPMFIYGVTDKSQKHSYGMIVFEDPDGAPGKVLCNWGINDGTTTGCQSRVGTMQEIQFSQPMVRANKTGKCAVDTIKISDTHYEYVMPLDDCVIVFLELEGERMHKHYTYGYNGIIPE